MKVLSSPAFAMQPPTRNVSSATPDRATAPASSARNGQFYITGCQGDKLVTNFEAFKILLLRLHPELKNKDQIFLENLWQYINKMINNPDTDAYYMSRTGHILSPRTNFQHPIFSLKLPTFEDVCVVELSQKHRI
jgi:hypothetical protein